MGTNRNAWCRLQRRSGNSKIGRQGGLCTVLDDERDLGKPRRLEFPISKDFPLTRSTTTALHEHRPSETAPINVVECVRLCQIIRWHRGASDRWWLDPSAIHMHPSGEIAKRNLHQLPVMSILWDVNQSLLLMADQFAPSEACPRSAEELSVHAPNRFSRLLHFDALVASDQWTARR